MIQKPLQIGRNARNITFSEGYLVKEQFSEAVVRILQFLRIS